MHRLFLATTVMFCLGICGCGKNTVDFDAQKTVAFDKARDIPEKLGGPTANKKGGKGKGVLTGGGGAP